MAAAATSRARSAAKKATKAKALKTTTGQPRTRKPFAAKLKTVVTDANVSAFLARVDAAQRDDAATLHALFAAATKERPRMWGSSIVGYGSYSYVGKSGRAGDWFMAGFSPRKGNLTLYMLGGWEGNKPLLKALGKHSLGKGCLYVSRLENVDSKVLKQLIADALKRAKAIKPKMMVNGGAD